MNKIEIQKGVEVEMYEHCNINAYIVFKNGSEYNSDTAVVAFDRFETDYFEIAKEYPHNQYTILDGYVGYSKSGEQHINLII